MYFNILSCLFHYILLTLTTVNSVLATPLDCAHRQLPCLGGADWPRKRSNPRCRHLNSTANALAEPYITRNQSNIQRRDRNSSAAICSGDQMNSPENSAVQVEREGISIGKSHRFVPLNQATEWKERGTVRRCGLTSQRVYPQFYLIFYFIFLESGLPKGRAFIFISVMLVSGVRHGTPVRTSLVHSFTYSQT
jgi:hypothetical protein